MKVASLVHNCGCTIQVPYLYKSDVFLNPAYCHICLMKFFPNSAIFFNADPTDNSIDEFEARFDR